MSDDRHESEFSDLELQFSQAYPDLRRRLRWYVLFRARGSGLDCENIVDEVICRVWRKIKSGTSLAALPYLAFKIAQNLIIDEYRKERLIPVDEPAEIADDFDLAEDRCGRVDLITAILALAPEQRELIALVYFGEQKVSDVARLLKIDRGRIERQLAKAKAELKRKLAIDSVSGSA